MSESVNPTGALQPVGIVITDQVAASIATKLDGIAKSATAANTTIDKLQAALNTLGTATLDKVVVQLDAIQAGLAKAAAAQSAYNTGAINGATAAARLATAQQQVAAATTRVATAATLGQAAQSRAAAAASGAAKAAVDLSTAQTRGTKAATDAAAAQDRAALAALRLQQAQDKAAASAHSGSSSLAEFAKSALLFVGLSYGVEEIAHLGDEYVQLQNRIQSVASSTADTNQVFAALFQISQETRSQIEQTVTSFQRLDTTMGQLGQTQAQTVSVVKTLNEVIALASPTARNAKNGILELDKAFSAGELHGQQLRAILTDLPQVINTLASHLELVNGKLVATATGAGISRGQFEALASQGKITAQVMAGALEDAASSVDAKFKTLTPTLFGAHGAVNVLQNDFIKIIGTLNQSLGITTGLAAAILALSNNLPQLEIALIAVGAAMLLAFGPAIISTIVAATVAVAAFAATPVGAIIVSIGAIVIALKAMGYSWVQIEIAAAQVLDQIAKDVLATVYEIQAIWNQIPQIFETAFKQAESAVLTVLADMDNKVIDAANAIRGGLGEALLPHEITPPKVDTGAYYNLGKAIAAAYNKGMNSGGIGATSSLQNILNPKSAGTDLLNAPRTGVITPPTAKPDKELASAENSILKAINPLHDYQVQLQAAKALLDAGKISQDQYNQEVIKATQAYKAASDPLYQFNRDMQQQLDVLKLLPDQQASAQKIQQIQNELLTKGIVLTDAQTVAIRKQIQAIKDATDASQAQARLMSLANQQKDFGTQATAISTLSKNKSSGFTSGDAASATSNLISSIGLDPKNLQVQAKSYISIYQKMYAEINTMRQKDLISERDAQTLRVQVFNQQNANYLNQATTFFSNLESMSSSHNSTMSAIGKAAAVANAIIHTYEAATEAYAAMASIPYVGPVLGAVAAGAAIAAGLANVEQIKSQPTGYMSGGYTGNLPTNVVAGNVHGQEYVMDAASVTRIGLDNLNALRAGAAGVVSTSGQAGKGAQAPATAPAAQGASGASSGATSLKHTNVNVFDPQLIGEFMKTEAGQTATLNMISKNPRKFRQVLSGS